MKCVLEYLEASAEKYPDKLAVVDDKEQATFSELKEDSAKIGFVLSGHVRAEMPVGVMLKKSVKTLRYFLGAVYAGGFYSLLDPDFPVERLRNQITILEPEVVITDEAYVEKLSETGYKGKVFTIDEIEAEASHVDLASDVVTGKLAEIRDAQSKTAPLYCNFTSGSTGTPKGVLVGQASVISFIDSFTELFHITDEDVIGNQAPFDFDVSVKDIFSSLKVGATMVIIPTAFFRFPNGVMDMLEKHGVTTLIWAVSALVLINRLHGFMYKVPPKIDKVLFSGEEMPMKHLREWISTYPDAEFVNLYGPTEITCNCTYYRIDNNNLPEEKLPLGEIFPEKTVEIFAEDGSLVTSEDEGLTGEICVSGDCLALGYYHNEEVTKAAFVEKTDGTRMYKTGDLGCFRGGQMYFAGRKDFQIKHNGHRLELEEIERALNSLDQVQQACCIYDMERYRIVAFYTGENDKKGIVEGLKKKLPDYMIPNVFTYMEELPLSKNGKLDRGFLRESLKKPAKK